MWYLVKLRAILRNCIAEIGLTLSKVNQLIWVSHPIFTEYLGWKRNLNIKEKIFVFKEPAFGTMMDWNKHTTSWGTFKDAIMNVNILRFLFFKIFSHSCCIWKDSKQNSILHNTPKESRSVASIYTPCSEKERHWSLE